MGKPSEVFIETQYLNGGKGPARRMLIISLDRFRQILEEIAGDVTAESFADDVYEGVVDACEDMD